jgi:hypothetical protein
MISIIAPAMCERGKNDTTLSSYENVVPSENTSIAIYPVQTRLSWLNITPLGLPVVPLV